MTAPSPLFTRRNLLGTALGALAAAITGPATAGNATSPVARVAHAAAAVVRTNALEASTSKRDTAPQPAAPLEIVMKEMLYSPSEVTIPANTDVPCTFRNAGLLHHDAVIPDTGIFTGVLYPGASVVATINLPPGTYVFYCTQSGHRVSGMVGTLTVV